MKKYAWIITFVLALALTLSACGAAQPAATAAPAKPFRVAVILPSAKNDMAFSQSMYDALVAIQKEMGADKFEFVFSENMFVVDDAAAAIRANRRFGIPEGCSDATQTRPAR